MKAYTVIAVSALLTITTSAQAEVYKWQDELCDMQGDFDEQKYSAEQIKNSHNVLDRLTRLNLKSISPPMNIKELNNTFMDDLRALIAEYKQVKSDVEQLDVVPEAQQYKQQLLKSIDGEYDKNRLMLMAHVNPIVAIDQSPPMCKHYIESFLDDETAVQNEWKQLIKDRIQQRSRYDKSRLQPYLDTEMGRYKRQKTLNAYKYARINLVALGFSDCVNRQVYRADSQIAFDNYDQLNKTLFGESLTMVCSEP